MSNLLLVKRTVDDCFKFYHYFTAIYTYSSTAKKNLKFLFTETNHHISDLFNMYKAVYVIVKKG